MMNRTRIVHTLGVIALALLAGMTIYLLPLKPSILELQFTFTPKAFSSVYDSWSDLARQRFKSHFTVDYLFIAAYSTWGNLHASNSRSMAAFGLKTRFLLSLAPPFAGVLDIVEDLFHQFITTETAPSNDVALYLIAGCAASLKWGIGLSYLGAIAVARRLTH